MFLLVSVATPADAAAALAGGADLIDAKDPAAGALGAVTLQTLREIRATVAGARTVTAALGDATDEDEVERTARGFAAAGARFVKVGFAGVPSPENFRRLVIGRNAHRTPFVRRRAYSRTFGTGIPFFRAMSIFTPASHITSVEALWRPNYEKQPAPQIRARRIRIIRHWFGYIRRRNNARVMECKRQQRLGKC